MPDATVVPAPQSPTILTTPPAAAPKAPEAVLYPPPAVPPVTPPAPPAVPPPPVVPPVTPPVVPPPTTPPVEPQLPKEPAKPADPASPAPVPADYVLTPAAGSLVSAEEAKSMTEYAKKSGLSKDQAEGLLKERETVLQQFQQRQVSNLQATSKQWYDEVKNDPLYGGEKFAEHAEKARRVIDRYAPAEMKAWLDQTGMANNPFLFRFVAAIGNILSEDQLVRGNTGSSVREKTPEERLYGATTPGAPTS